MTKDAVIRDRGYSGYDGPRRPGRAARVLAVHTARSVLQRKAVKRFLLLSWLAAFVTGAVLYMERRLGGAGSGARHPLSLLTQPFGVVLPVLFTVLIAAGSTLAEDRRNGALPFYFSRPLRPIDYLLGRLGGVAAVLLALAAAPTTAVALYRVLQCDHLSDALRALGVALVIALLGALLCLIGAIYALLAGAITPSRGAAQGFVGAVFVLPWMLAGVGANVLDGPWVSLLSLPHLIGSLGEPLIAVLSGQQRSLIASFVTFGIEDAPARDPRLAPLVALAALIAIAAGGLLWLRSRIEQLGRAGGDAGGGA